MPRTLVAELHRSAASAWPAEACGVLGGRRDVRRWRLAVAAPLRNLAGARNFAADPVEFARVEAELRASGRSLCGFYHSHPHGSADPSPEDLAAAWQGCLMLVVPIRAGEPRTPALFWPTHDGARPVHWEADPP